MSVTVEIVNYKESVLWIEKESEKFEKEGWMIIVDTALIVMDAMKRFIKPSVITGRLRASVHIETTDSKLNVPRIYKKYNQSKWKAEDQTFDDSVPKNEIWVGTNVIYAKNVDEGGRAKGFFDKAIRKGDQYLKARLNRANGSN